jgi:CTP:molybdopterin cytidylyltransferase MocA
LLEKSVTENRGELTVNGLTTTSVLGAVRMSPDSPTPVRVVLADMPRLTQELIRRILEAEPGVEVVIDANDLAVPLPQLLEETGADVAIVGAETLHLIEECRELLDERARLRVLTVSADGQEGHLYGLRPYETAVEDFSPEFVLEVVTRPRVLQ